MKAVWILEKYSTRDDLEKTLLQAMEARDTCPEDSRDFANEFVEIAKRQLEKYPDGRWDGMEGKTSYLDFCYVAKGYIRRHRSDNYKLRVVKAEIEDNANYWPGYKNPVENEAVLKYLYATA